MNDVMRNMWLFSISIALWFLAGLAGSIHRDLEHLAAVEGRIAAAQEQAVQCEPSP